MSSSPIEAVLVGAGGRGTFTYGRAALAHPDSLRFVAVAEPDGERRTRFAELHQVVPEKCFATWQELLAAGPLAPALVCCTLDRQHAGPAIAAMKAGYHVLLEKPMGVTEQECLQLVRTQETTRRILMICHVLRFAPFFERLYEVVRSGRLGDIVTVQHSENIAYWHMAHSYVRGNWSDSSRSSPMILSKCCHDFDLLVWMMQLDHVTRLYSSGSLLHFRPEHAPPGATLRCLDGCPAADACPFFAPRLYLTDDVGWPTETISVNLSYAARLRALQTGPYGQCVYQAGNTVVDHQVVAMEFAGGAVATLVMNGHAHREERTMRWDGTRATLRARFSYSQGSEMSLHDHLSGRTENLWEDGESLRGHGGGDERLLAQFANAVRGSAPHALTAARTSMESHLLAFAAERSRLAGSAIDMQSFRSELEREVHQAAD